MIEYCGSRACWSWFWFAMERQKPADRMMFQSVWCLDAAHSEKLLTLALIYLFVFLTFFPEATLTVKITFFHLALQSNLKHNGGQ